MIEEKNYNNVVELIAELEANKYVRKIKDNRETLITYWNIGKSIVDAQGGAERANYGDNLIKKWSEKLSQEFGNAYKKTQLFNMRQFYLCFPKFRSLSGILSWTHYRYLLPIKNENERNYYINQVILNNLSVRELRNEIKNKSFERLSYADKENIKLINTDNYSLTLSDMLKEPIIIKTNKDANDIEEKVLHKLLISMLENKFLELGIGFALLGHEYKIKIDNRTYKIDLLFFNYKINAFVVVEIKAREYMPKDKGQIEFYMEYIDKNIKEKSNNKTEGILIVKKKNKYVVEYVSNKNLYITTYKLEKEGL